MDTEVGRFGRRYCGKIRLKNTSNGIARVRNCRGYPNVNSFDADWLRCGTAAPDHPSNTLSHIIDVTMWALC